MRLQWTQDPSSNTRPVTRAVGVLLGSLFAPGWDPAVLAVRQEQVLTPRPEDTWNQFGHKYSSPLVVASLGAIWLFIEQLFNWMMWRDMFGFF